jgi:hypothetical protein
MSSRDEVVTKAEALLFRALSTWRLPTPVVVSC